MKMKHVLVTVSTLGAALVGGYFLYKKNSKPKQENIQLLTEEKSSGKNLFI